jgi:transcriptional regulator with XRE-family HTH domain
MSRPTSPGLRLKEAREAQGKTLSELAKQTRIGMQQLEGIERDNYDRIPAAIYVKGFVKNYAQALGLDPAPLVKEVERILSGEEEKPEEDVQERNRVPEPVAEEEIEEPRVVTEPLRPNIGSQAKTRVSDTFSDLTDRLKEGLSSIELPVDRRLGLIAGTVLVVLVLVFGIRGCAGDPDASSENPAELPVRDLENLLIATPEPILFELPRTTP